MRWLAALLTLWSFSASAQSVNIVTTADPKETLSVITRVTDAHDGVTITAYAASEAVTSITMRGDSASLTTCSGQFCLFTWARSSMIQRKCVQCELVVIANESSTGRSYRVKTEVTRP